MIGGIGVLGILLYISSGISKYGFVKIFQKSLQRIKEKENLNDKEIIDKIENYRFISKDLKLKIKDFFESKK